MKKFSNVGLKTFLLLTNAILAIGCTSSSSTAGANNNETGTNGNPFSEILSYAVGSFAGECVSLTTGQNAPSGRITFSDTGVLNGSDFTSNFSASTHTVSFTQTRNSPNAAIITGEWDGHKESNVMPTDELLLRYSSVDSDTRVNEAFARLENTSDKGLSCKRSNTSQVIDKDMHLNFVKYINNPKVAFTMCSCTDAGGATTSSSASSFQSTRSAVTVQGKSMNLAQGFLEQSVSYSSAPASFIYSLTPTSNSLTTYIFDQNLNLKQFAAEFESGDSCVCQ